MSIFSSNVLFGQDWSLKDVLKLPGNPTAYSIDIQNNFYLGFEDGTMLKFDAKGSQLLNYSLPNQSSITLIEAQNALKTFLFYFDNQQIITLDRFNAVPKIYNLGEYDINLGLMACPSPDENFWVVENNPMRIKKIDPLRNVTLLEVQTNLGDSVRFMRTFKNLLLVLNEKELQIFDLFGSRISTIDDLNAHYFQIVKNKLMLVSNDQLFTIDPFEGVIEEKRTLPEEEVTGFFTTVHDTFLIKGSTLLVYD